MQAGSSELDRQQNGAHYFPCTLSKENISLIFRFVNSTISEVNASAASRPMTLVLTQHYKVVGVLTQTGCQTLFELERNFWDVLSGLPRAHFSSVYLCVWLVGWLSFGVLVGGGI